MRLIQSFYDGSHLQDLISWGSKMGGDLQQMLDNIGEIGGVIMRDFGVNSPDNFFVEAFHILSSEGGLQGGHFINNAP